MSDDNARLIEKLRELGNEAGLRGFLTVGVPYEDLHVLLDALEQAEKRLQWYTDVLMCRFGPDVEIREGKALHGRRFIDDVEDMRLQKVRECVKELAANCEYDKWRELIYPTLVGDPKWKAWRTAYNRLYTVLAEGTDAIRVTLPVSMRDLADMPDFNAGVGSHGLHSVSEGQVYWDLLNKISCREHGAMNAVNLDRTIWRCLTCHQGAWVQWAQE